jgi:hypothetical protein
LQAEKNGPQDGENESTRPSLSSSSLSKKIAKRKRELEAASAASPGGDADVAGAEAATAAMEDSQQPAMSKAASSKKGKITVSK